MLLRSVGWRFSIPRVMIIFRAVKAKEILCRVVVPWMARSERGKQRAVYIRAQC